MNAEITTVVVDESRPRIDWKEKGPPECLQIKNPNGGEIRQERLRDAIERSGHAANITQLYIDYTSLTRSTWIVECLPNLIAVTLEGKHLRSLEDLTKLKQLRSLRVAIENKSHSMEVLTKLHLDYLSAQPQRPEHHIHIGSCRGVREMQLWSWKENDLSALRQLGIRKLRLVRANCLELNGLKQTKLQRLWLQDCSKILTLGIQKARTIELEACKRLDLNSLQSVKNLLSLTLRAVQRPMESVEFLSGCESLRILCITAMRLKKKDFTPIINSKSLRFVWLSALKDSIAREIGEKNRKLVLCNGGVCMDRGELAGDFLPFYNGEKQFLKSKKLWPPI